MDKNVFNQLLTAFESAPSAELAEVITFELLEQERFEEVGKYIGHLPEDLDRDQSMRLLENSRHFDSALLTYIESLADPAQKRLLELTQSVSTDLLSDQLQSFAQLKINTGRPKLHVVEKTEVADFVELSRYREQTTTFDDVVGLEAIKSQVRKKIILPFQKPSLIQRFRKKIGGGVLLYGPPGCGKTLMARATAGECGAKFFNIEASDVLDMYIGQSEQKLRAIFEKARQEAPSVLFFDELEALAGKREASKNNSAANVVSQFLSELDGFSQNNDGVLVLASTNVPWSIDSAFLRPGRFDRVFFVPPPDQVARKGILDYHFKDRLSESGIDFGHIAKATSGYSGADLENLIDIAVDEAIDDSLQQDKEVPISQAHLKAALAESRPTTLEWLTTARNYARYANDGGRYDDVLEFIKRNGR